MNSSATGTNDQQPTPPHGIGRDGAAASDSSLLAEIARLEAAIAAANSRTAAARARHAQRESEVREQMRGDLQRVQHQLAEMDAAHEARLAEVRAAADAEIESIRIAARAAEKLQ